MAFKHWLLGAAGALALSALSVSAQAAPLGVGSEDLKAVAEQNTVVQDVVWVRRCWRHRGHRHCRMVWLDRPYYYDAYPYGGYYSYGPSFGFSFGGGHRHHHHHHHHGHRHGGHRHR
jgi:hypothetical protein